MVWKIYTGVSGVITTSVFMHPDNGIKRFHQRAGTYPPDLYGVIFQKFFTFKCSAVYTPWAGTALSISRLATGWTVWGSNADRGGFYRTCPDWP